MGEFSARFRDEDQSVSEYSRSDCSFTECALFEHSHSIEKFVMVSQQKRIYYDRLFMFCGIQFDYPVLIPTPAKQPKNMIFVNNSLEAEVMLIKIMHLQKRSDNCMCHIVTIVCVFYV